MKKAMLFFAAFLFSVGANAATLNLTTAGSTNATQAVDLSNNSTVLAGGVVSNNNSTWSSLFDLKSDKSTPVVIEWTFNPQKSLGSATLSFGVAGGPFTLYNITSDFSFSAAVAAGVTYWVDIFDASSNILSYDLSISAVPVPAALFLFAPALFGFMAMRRRASLSKTVTA